MDQVATVGLDIAKSVFQVHGVDAAGQVVVRRQIRRAQLLQYFAKLPACLVGIDPPPKKWTGLGRSTLGVRWADVAQG